MEYAPETDGFASWFLLFVAAFWLGGVALLSLAGGWHRLASRFRDHPTAQGETFRFATMYLRSGGVPVSYVNCLVVTVSPAGIRVSTLFLYRLLHPPLFIPWSAVETVMPEELWSLKFMAVRLRGTRTRLLFTEPVARKLVTAFNARYSTMSA